VLSGEFDPRPPRDVLTSLLNGVGPYKAVEKDDEARRIKKRERKAREKEKMRLKKLAAKDSSGGSRPLLLPPQVRAASHPVVPPSASGHSTPAREFPAVNSSTSSFWRARGPVVAATRSVSPTPPPEVYSPGTPGPSDSSTVSRTSSKRPHTPDDFSWFTEESMASPHSMMTPKLRKKRSAARKGWKGWVEGSPPPSDKLINLDTAPVMQERRTRSGKNFDAIGEGQDTWVDPDH